jgi:hypothetical protein
LPRNEARWAPLAGRFDAEATALAAGRPAFGARTPAPHPVRYMIPDWFADAPGDLQRAYDDCPGTT